eukprot:CAMPEP_0182610976 /NCGR_PEP_ID=MMETSP1330-20130603/11631_1 /TAXON_ID=464278 /ORGANISM="Picochlorum sp., Strain RCC944" /LENGTH=334 /DNA_ID=CAMNT_0024830305 /DNA_START=250 /DNA_END=1254 /DNA_ORIENTATION=+
MSYSSPDNVSTTTKLKQKAQQELQALTERLSAFGEKAKRVLTRNKASASEYHNLSESLLSQDEAAGNGGGGQQPIGGDYFAGGRQQQQQQSHSSPQIGSWSGMIQHHHQSASEHVPGMADIPSEAEMMVQTTMLAREAAELLWETIAFQAGCENPDPQMKEQLEDLADKGKMLNSQLRGLIRNHLQSGGGSDGSSSETMLASALETKDMLDSCLGEYDKQNGSEPTAAAAAVAAPSASVPIDGNNSKDKLESVDALDAPPLIQLDDVFPPAPTVVATTGAGGSVGAGVQQQQPLPQSSPSNMEANPFADGFDTLAYHNTNANTNNNNVDSNNRF